MSQNPVDPSEDPGGEANQPENIGASSEEGQGGSSRPGAGQGPGSGEGGDKGGGSDPSAGRGINPVQHSE